MFVTVNDLNTYYTKEDGENAVLFLHGWGCDSSTMKVLAENIDRPVVSLDLWGFGRSEAPPEVWGSHEYASALARFCDSAGLRKTDIVAHSFGGRIALALAADMPERVGKIVLAGGAGLRKKSFVRWLKQKAFKICRKTGMNTKFAGSDDYRNAQGIMKKILVRVVREDLSEEAKKITSPVLLIYGTEDRETPLWIMHRYNRLIRNSGCVKVKNGGHFCFLTHTRFVAAAVNSFFKE